MNVQVPYAGGCTKVLVKCGHINPMCEYAQGLSTPYANIRITYASTFPNFISKYTTTRTTGEYISPPHIWVYELHMRMHTEAFNPICELLGFSSSPRAFNLVYEYTNLV